MPDDKPPKPLFGFIRTEGYLNKRARYDIEQQNKARKDSLDKTFKRGKYQERRWAFDDD